MLIGSNTHSVDAKGRVFLPAKWRDDLGETVIVTRDTFSQSDSRCLFAMSLAAWNEFYARFKPLGVSDIRAQNALRVLFANACECEVDKQGRVLISAPLREYAGLSEDAVLIGMVDRVEIWNPAALEEHDKLEGAGREDALSYLAELGV